MSSIEKGPVVDVNGTDAIMFSLGVDLTQGEQKPIAIVMFGPESVLVHKIDISEAREIQSALADLIKHVSETKVN